MMLMANFSKEGGLSVSLLHPEGNNYDGDDDSYVIMTYLLKEGRLTLSFLHPEDVGDYSCTATNSHGNNTRSVYLEVSKHKYKYKYSFSIL